jgi:type IV pilus biogenesis protein CpaD/CtpE
MPSNATPAALAGAAAAAAVKPEVKLDIPVHERSRLAASARAAYLKQLDEYESAALNALEQEMGVRP